MTKLELTTRQTETISFINSAVFKVGKDKTIKLQMNINDGGGFWVDFKSQWCAGYVTASDSETDMERVFSDAALFVDITKSKKNRDLQADVIFKLLNFYR